jgi:hypothetical protein
MLDDSPVETPVITILPVATAPAFAIEPPSVEICEQGVVDDSVRNGMNARSAPMVDFTPTTQLGDDAELPSDRSPRLLADIEVRGSGPAGWLPGADLLNPLSQAGMATGEIRVSAGPASRTMAIDHDGMASIDELPAQRAPAKTLPPELANSADRFTDFKLPDRVRAPWLTRSVIEMATSEFDIGSPMLRTQPAARSTPVNGAAVTDDSAPLAARFDVVSNYLAEVRRPRTQNQWLRLDAMLNNHLQERSGVVMGDEALVAGTGSTVLVPALLGVAGESIATMRGMERHMVR